MESEGSNRHPKRRKGAQFPSNSTKDSNLALPILPGELITEILWRLPVKSLLKFRSVSKSWLSLISSPEFIDNHLRLSANNEEDTHHLLILSPNGDEWNFKECLIRSLFDDSVTVISDLGHPIENDSKHIKIVGSCNGLVFLTNYTKYSLLWNPTTRMHKNLPDFRAIWNHNKCAMYGFGYDELHNDYKVVAILFDFGSTDGVEVIMYSLKSDSWTSVDYCDKEIVNSSGSNKKMRLTGSGVFANGKLHWDTISVVPFLGGFCRMGRKFCSFDLGNEKWEMIEKPSYGVGETDLRLGTLGSDICVFTDYKRTHVSAWVMNEYGVKESWIKKFTISYPIGQHIYPPFFMSNKGEILALFESTFMVYNSKNDALRYPHVINHNYFYGAGIYVESLVCPFSTEVTDKATKESRKKLKSKQSSDK